MRPVMEQLGHSQITLTMNTYAHIAPELLRGAADKLNARPAAAVPAAVPCTPRTISL
jgi:integrase